MCGIIGYTGPKAAKNILLNALKRLEYRGYDSAGIAVINNELNVFKDKGDIDHLIDITPEFKGTQGIGHTRWATHGKPIKNNSHPFKGCKGNFAIVHNGIIDNFNELKDDLLKKGHIFSSETDTEVIVHLLEDNYEDNLEDAMRKVVKKLRGSFAIVAITTFEKDKVVGARMISPLIVGVGHDENFIASDVPAVLEYTNNMIYLLDEEIVTITSKSVDIQTFDGDPVERDSQKVDMTLDGAEKGGYEHFMLKEIFEQPKAIHNTLLGEVLNFDSYVNSNHISNIKIIACGTSYHAGLVGKHIIENLANIPTTVELASEYRFQAEAGERPLVIAISQSGETLDTMSAIRLARRRGLRTMSIVNIVSSTLTRETDETFYTRADLEIGVAATKTYITQIIAMYILAIRFGRANGSLSPDRARRMTNRLRDLPKQVKIILNDAQDIKRIAEKIADSRSMFFLGRNINYPVALEGALKMKEISYIHAEGYPGGELKHGPLALITEETPVIAIAVKDYTYEKMLGNIGEVSARGSPVVGIGNKSDNELKRYVDEVIKIPDVHYLFTPVLTSVVMQLLSYYVADARDCEIDKPRHLAKSVTVE